MDADVYSGPDATQLLALLGQQRDLYDRLRDLSERQRNLISGERPEMLLDILRDRQSLVMALARVNEELSPYRRDWERTYSRLNAETRASVGVLLNRINGTLQAILRTDHEDGALLAARKQAVGRAMDEVSDNRVANAAYAQHSFRASDRRADLTG
jgi:hypothetical protein